MENTRYGSTVPEVMITSATPNESSLSFEPAPSEKSRWELKPYKFNCPSLPQDGSKELSELASIKLPDYHLLVDHAIGVAWKCFSNGHRDLRALWPDQVMWAKKFAEAHTSQGQRSKYSEYLGEIFVSLCAGGMGLWVHPEQLNFLKPEELVESSFVLTNMRGKDDTILAPSAASTPLPRYEMPPLCSSPVAQTPGLSRITSPRPSQRGSPRTAASTSELINNLRKLREMVIRWKENRLKTVEGEMGHLEDMERLLHAMVANDRQPSPS